MKRNEERMAEWFADESFWIATYPFIFSSERLDAAEEEVEKILSLLDFQGHSILDLCCGPGRHSVALAKRGFSVTGVDQSPFLLEKARERGQAENVQVEWVLDDMRNFVREGAYDLAMSMFTSFGLFDNRDDDLRVLQNIFRSLKPEGACLIDVMGKERLARIFQPITSREAPDGSILVERHEVFDDWGRIRNEWILVKDERARSFKFHLILYSGYELKECLFQAGFSEVRVHGNLDGDEYGPHASRLVAVAWKSTGQQTETGT